MTQHSSFPFKTGSPVLLESPETSRHLFRVGLNGTDGHRRAQMAQMAQMPNTDGTDEVDLAQMGQNRQISPISV